MVVLELLRWKAPASLILAVVMLCHIPKFQPRHVENNFVEMFAGEGAITSALRDAGLVGSSHDIQFSNLMDMCSVHGFLYRGCTLFKLWCFLASFFWLGYYFFLFLFHSQSWGWPAVRFGILLLVVSAFLAFAAIASQRCGLVSNSQRSTWLVVKNFSR